MMQRYLSPAFLLLLLLMACGAPGEGFDEFTFTAEEMAELDAILDEIEDDGTDAVNGERTETTGGGEGRGAEEVVLDVSDAHRFANLQTGIGSLDANTFRVTNAFLNVRSQPNVHSELVDTLNKGDRVTALSFPNARWAEIELPDRRRGHVATAYIAQIVTEEELPRVKARYEGQYEVNFRFLNVRAEPLAGSQKLGELVANQIIRPIEISGGWARIPFEGKEGYVSSQYLRPFSPTVIVRQERFALPVLRYRADGPLAADTLLKHLAFLKSQGKTMITLRNFHELLLLQEERDIRLPPGNVLLLISDVTPATIGEIPSVLRASAARATVFLQTADIGPDGISPQVVRMLVANGNDVQSAGHVGGDLRALTNRQARLDLAQSRQILEDLTGREIFAVAYPQGGVNDRVAQQAVEAGYLFGITLAPSGDGGFDRSQFLRLPVNTITPAMTEQTLGTIVGIAQ